MTESGQLADSKPCIFCYAELVHEPTEACESVDIDESVDDGRIIDVDIPAELIPSNEPIEARPVGRPPKDASEMSNIEAAGRKRSVRAKPIRTGDLCEWAYLWEAGGGIIPIQGCPGNPARHLHHGPDKSVMNNDVVTNLSKVCTHCHSRWHVANDEYYKTPRPSDGSAWLPDDELADGLVFYDLRLNGPKMTKVQALQIEMERNQDDARGRIK